MTATLEDNTTKSAEFDSPDYVAFQEQKLAAAQLAQELITNIPYCPWTPNPGPQSIFLLDFGREALYGGAAGGGKSIALLMAASMFLTVPGYSALLLRKKFSDLTKPGALMDIADQWWGPLQLAKRARFDTQENTWYFYLPGGRYSRIVFGYIDKANDKYNYQGGAYNFIGFDEVTQHKSTDYTYLFSRMRRVKDPTNPLSRVPIRMRSTANPGGTGHKWVFTRFIAPWQAWKEKGAEQPKRNFYPALIKDNPKLDEEDYIESLMELDPVTRAQLMRGDWNIRPEARFFRKDWFKPILAQEIPAHCTWVRYWDMASTEENPEKDTLRGGPDFTAGALLGRHPDGRIFIADIRHWRHDPAVNDMMCMATCLHDTQRVIQVMEQEPGSSGKTAIYHYRTQVFHGMNFRGMPSTGSKSLRAGPFASMAQAGQVFYVVDGTWDAEDFFDEAEAFPDPTVHDDRVDAVAGAYSILSKMVIGKINFGQRMNDDLMRENPWRPDVTLVLSPADLAAGGGVLGARMEAARMTARDMQRNVASAWAV